MTSTTQSSDDETQYHPYDHLVLKYYPDKDLVALRQDWHRLEVFYEAAARREKNGQAPPRIPWPLPPPRPRDELEAGVEEWRSAALRVFDMHLNMYKPGLALQKTFNTKSPQTSDPPTTLIKTHRALLVPELRELILRHAPPAAQFTARNVNHAWRDTIEYILGSQHRDYYPCPPVEYGQLIDADLPVSQPSDDEIAEAEQRIAMFPQMSHYDASRVHYTASIAQSLCLSEVAHMLSSHCMSARGIFQSCCLATGRDNGLTGASSQSIHTFWNH
jgi:hypothetical protein